MSTPIILLEHNDTISDDALDRCILQCVNFGRVYVSLGETKSNYAAEIVASQREILGKVSTAMGTGPPPEVIHRPLSIESTMDVIKHSIAIIKSLGELHSDTAVIYCACKSNYFHLSENIKAMVEALEKYPSHSTMAFTALPYHSVVVEENPNQQTHPGGSLQTYPPAGSRPRWEHDGCLMGWRAGYFLDDLSRQMWQGQLIPVPVQREHIAEAHQELNSQMEFLERRVYAIESGVVYNESEEVIAG